ncbi:hypothetical protein B296_00042810 [Ensete ventricosum]|uniref:Uncharacterized protein n=1 Tax=Ensete ventricosum TaxID=4639 RepID=A0A426ZHB5_ENSVE|nr:hypothetical protein B296_00042810 [Ensete ventricosum]
MIASAVDIHSRSLTLRTIPIHAHAPTAQSNSASTWTKAGPVSRSRQWPGFDKQEGGSAGASLAVWKSKVAQLMLRVREKASALHHDCSFWEVHERGKGQWRRRSCSTVYSEEMY